MRLLKQFLVAFAALAWSTMAFGHGHPIIVTTENNRLMVDCQWRFGSSGVEYCVVGGY